MSSELESARAMVVNLELKLTIQVGLGADVVQLVPVTVTSLP